MQSGGGSGSTRNWRAEFSEQAEDQVRFYDHLLDPRGLELIRVIAGNVEELERDPTQGETDNGAWALPHARRYFCSKRFLLSYRFAPQDPDLAPGVLRIDILRELPVMLQ